MENDQVTFRYKDTATGQTKYCTLTAEEFIRRFLQHVLPKGFVKVRYYGLFSPTKRDQLDQIRLGLLIQAEDPPMTIETGPQAKVPHPLAACLVHNVAGRCTAWLKSGQSGVARREPDDHTYRLSHLFAELVPILPPGDLNFVRLLAGNLLSDRANSPATWSSVGATSPTNFLQRCPYERL